MLRTPPDTDPRMRTGCVRVLILFKKKKKKMGGSGALIVFAGLLLVLRIPPVLNYGSSSLSESSSDGLTVRNVYLELKDVSGDWDTLGFLLGLSQKRLDTLDKGCTNKVDLCYRRMLDAWFDEDLDPSWDKLVWSLDQMGQNRLAESIRERYTCSECTGKHANAEVNVGLGNHKERMQKIESEYTKLAYKVMTSMEDKKVDMKMVKFWLTQIPVSLKYTQKHFLEGTPVQLISRAESLLEVFGHLAPYWNFLDYGLLEYMVTEFGNDEVRQSMRRYIHKLTMFRKSVTVSEFRKLWPNEMDPPPDFSRLVINLNRTQSHMTLQDVEELRLNVAKNYSLTNFALMYGALQGGSVVLTWFIPSSVAPQLVQDVRNGGSGFLKEHNITEVSIDGHTVAITDSNGRIWNLIPNVTTPVHFWRTKYAYFLQPGKDIILSCSRTCAKASPPVWYHTLSKDPWLPMSQIATGPELELSLHQPPVTTDVGYFCCACIGDHLKVDATCFGVAYMPYVTHFSITRKGKAVSGVHIGDQIMVECEVYGFPSHVDIISHSEIAESPQHTEVSVTWYSKMQYINIPHATINHSGVYTCAALVHASPDLYVMTENVKRSLVVYAPPAITGLRRLTQSELKMLNYPLDSDVISCDVTSSVFFNVIWLFNGKAVNDVISKCSIDYNKSDKDKFMCTLEVPQSFEKGTCECIVNTAFDTRETTKTLKVCTVLTVCTVLAVCVAIVGLFMVGSIMLIIFFTVLDHQTSDFSSLTVQKHDHHQLSASFSPLTVQKHDHHQLPASFSPLTGQKHNHHQLSASFSSPTVQKHDHHQLSASFSPLTVQKYQSHKEHPNVPKPNLLQQPRQDIPKQYRPSITITGVSCPTGMAVNDRGEIVVAEQNCISIFTCSGEKIRTFGSELFLPRGVTFDDAGNILVTEVQFHCIKNFKPDGEFLTAVGRKGSRNLEFNFPTGIGINHKNKKVYVCDQRNNRVQILNEDLTFAGNFGDYEEFKYPWDVAFDSAGSVYIVHNLNHCIQVFTPAGSILRKFGKKGSGEGELKWPSSVSIDSNDIVYVADKGNHRVSIFTCQGDFVRSFGIEGERPGEFKQPHGIAMDTSGLLYVSDTLNNQVQGFKNLMTS